MMEHWADDVAPPSQPRTGTSYLARLILRGWWVPLLASLAAAGLAAFFVARQTPVYRAEATFVVQPSEVVLGSREATINSINVLDRRTIVNTFAEIARSQSVALRAAEHLGYPAERLARLRTRAVVLPETFVIEVAVEGDDAALAASLADAIVQQAGAYALQAYPAYQIRGLDAAITPAVPVAPRSGRDVALAAAAGLMVGLLGALGFGYLAEQASRREPAETLPALAPSFEPR